MKYMMFVVSDAQPDQPSDESDIDLWVDPLDSSGKRVIGEILAPPAESTVVRVRGGKVLATRGPFAETSEVILGFDILEVTDLDEAIEIASRHPMARNGQIELRAFAPWDAEA
ncbi:YciI family protein [Microbacterium sp. 2FI]|uniref:YciI family protein n=1 Tax=Microbacterium sp. 2FI TaxID=2502193 RepID=UPI0010F86AA1|nr:YciI family protein [Microbacterium sp. 2FI]